MPVLHVLSLSTCLCHQVDELLNAQQDDFDREYRNNEEDLRDLNDQVQRLDDKIIDLNEAVSTHRTLGVFDFPTTNQMILAVKGSSHVASQQTKSIFRLWSVRKSNVIVPTEMECAQRLLKTQKLTVHTHQIL